MNLLRAINQLAGAVEPGAARGSEFLWYARLLARSPDDILTSLSIAEREKSTPERVVTVLRAAVAAGTTTDPAWASALVPYQTLASQFLASLATASVYDRLLSDGMRRVPLKTRIIVFNTGFSGNAVGEAMVKPVSLASLSAPVVEPRKSTAVIVASDELLKLGTPSSITLFNAELKQGVVRATDRTFIDELLASVTPTASAGSSAANVNTDLGTLLAALSMGDTSRPYVVMPPATARGLTLKLTTAGDLAFENMGLFGGEIANGVPALVSDQVPAGTVLAVDATGIIGDSDLITVDASRHTSLDMGGPPDSPPTSATNVVPLWQLNLAALRAERHYGFSIARSGSVAALSGVSW
jgi:hypothetical protein